jgi:hypothetical protein
MLILPLISDLDSKVATEPKHRLEPAKSDGKSGGTNNRGEPVSRPSSLEERVRALENKAQ